MSVEKILRSAIADRIPLALHYEGGGMRTVHPQVLFRTSDRKICVDVYQVAGSTTSGRALPSWRQLDLLKIDRASLLDGAYEPAPGLNLAADKYRHGILAHV